MAIPLTDTFGFTPNKPNIDKRYLASNGQPYASVAAAETALASRLVETCVGLTVLVKESGWTEAKEYWVQPYDNNGVTAYHLVEKGAGTTDYAALDNKPTVGDGTNTDLPIAGHIKVTASTASGNTAGVTVTPGQNTGEIKMEFTLPKGADGVPGNNGSDGQDGAPGHNPCLGVFADLTSLQNAHSTAEVGDYAYVDVTDSTTQTTTKHIFRYSGSAWVDNGEGSPDKQTAFDGGTGPTVAGTKIDDTKLAHPASNALAKAEDVKALVDNSVGNLDEKLYGTYDDTTSEVIILSNSSIGKFINPSEETNNAYISSGNDRKGYIEHNDFEGLLRYKFLRITQGSYAGGITFVKKDAPSSSMTYQALVEGGYLSSVHDSYENVVFDLPANTTTDVEIPEDAYTAYFLYRKASDGSSSSTTLRKPTMVVGYGLKTEGDIDLLWNEIRGGGDEGGSIDGQNLIDGSVGSEKLAENAVEKSITSETEEYLSFELIDYKNLVNGTCINESGEYATTTVGSTYRATNFIPLKGKKVYWYGMGSVGTATNGGAVYTANKEVIRVFRPGSASSIGSYDPVDADEGAEFIRLTLVGNGSLHYCVYAKSDGTNPMADQSTITTSAIDDYYRDQVINHAGLNIVFPKENIPELIPAFSALGQNGFSKTYDIIGPEQENTYGIVESTEYPSYLKCCHMISFKGFLNTSLGDNDYIRFGIDRNSTTGKAVDITATHVKIKRYDANNGYVTNVEFAHELNISDFVMCVVSFSWFGGKIRLTTINGSFVQEWQNSQYSYSGNAQVNYGRVFLEPSIALTNVKISQSSDRFMKPVWVIGDSYTSMAAARWTYQLINNFGIDEFLLDGYAGAPSENMVPELKRLLQYGTPKYLIWCLGMNDGPVIWKYCSTEVEMLCRERGITLVYQTIPRPSSDQGEGIGKKGIINNYIKESGYRYIDVFDAVTENRETGAWYSGMLDDGTHPTVLGAKVIAGQVLVDFPEIANYK